MRILLLAALLAPGQLRAQVKPPCTDMSLVQCREEFARVNMPAPTQINPNSPRLQPIRDAIAAAKLAESRQDAAEAEIKRMEEVLSDLRKDDPAHPASVESILSYRRLRDDAVKEKFKQRNEAIDQAIKIYGLVPGVVSAPPHAAVTLGSLTVSPWCPRYSENQEVDASGHGRLLNETEKLDLARRAGYPQGSKMDIDGGTRRDSGRVGIFPHAFDRPELLAATIMHETVHWLDQAAAGAKIQPYDSYMSEIKAYNAVAGEATTFGLTAADVGSMVKMSGVYARQANSAAGLTWGQVGDLHPNWLQGASPAGADDPQETRPEQIREKGDLSFIDGWREGGAAVAGTVAAGRAVTLREAAEADEWFRQRRELAERIAAIDADFERRYPPYRRSQMYVQALAGEACGDPSRLPKLADDGRIVRLDLTRDTPSYQPADRLSECQLTVLDRFDATRQGGSTVRSADFMSWACAYRAAHPSLIAKLGRAFTGFAEIFTGLFSGGGGSGLSGSHGSTVERSSRSEPTYGCEYTYIPELNQTIRSCPVN